METGNQSKERVGKMQGSEHSKGMPVGIIPRRIWLESRRDDIYEAIKRRRDSRLAPPLEWIEELLNLEREIQGRQQ